MPADMSPFFSQSQCFMVDLTADHMFLSPAVFSSRVSSWISWVGPFFPIMVMSLSLIQVHVSSARYTGNLGPMICLLRYVSRFKWTRNKIPSFIFWHYNSYRIWTASSTHSFVSVRFLHPSFMQSSLNIRGLHMHISPSKSSHLAPKKHSQSYSCLLVPSSFSRISWVGKRIFRSTREKTRVCV